MIYKNVAKNNENIIANPAIPVKFLHTILPSKYPNPKFENIIYNNIATKCTNNPFNLYLILVPSFNCAPGTYFPGKTMVPTMTYNKTPILF